MTESRQHTQPKPAVSLNQLLLRLPTPGGDASDAEWKARLDQTVQRVTSTTQPTTSRLPTVQCELADEELLRTPLPREVGEPEPIDPFSFEDPLRVPLKSGEHAPVRLEHRVTSELRPAPAVEISPAASRRTPSWAYWLSGGIGAAAAAAALVLAVRSREPLDLEPNVALTGASPSPNAAVAVAATPQPQEQPAPPSEVESPTAAPSELVRAAAASRAVARPSLADSKRSAGAAKLAPNKVPESPPVDEEPLVPAAGPSNLTERPSVGAINAALASGVPVAQRCLTPEIPSASVRIVFQSNGSVQSVQVTAATPSAEMIACIQRAFSRARVEAFAQPRAEVTRMISLPNP